MALSALVTIRRGDRARTVLFDAGITPDGCVENLRRLGKDPADIEAIVCSHGHFDHTAGLSGLADRLGRRNLPVLIHPEFWTRRRLAIPGREPLETPTTSRRALEEVGFSVVEQQRPSFLLDGALLVTGEVDRTTDFEQGFLIHQAYRGETWVPDPLILDDQALNANVAGQGLVILTGCGHAGIVNICRYAQRLTGQARVHTVLGGFHLNGPLFEPIIPATLDALDQLQPDVVVPAHCTGWRAVHALAARFPQQFIQNSVGTTFRLGGDHEQERVSQQPARSASAVGGDPGGCRGDDVHGIVQEGDHVGFPRLGGGGEALGVPSVRHHPHLHGGR